MALHAAERLVSRSSRLPAAILAGSLLLTACGGTTGSPEGAERTAAATASAAPTTAESADCVKLVTIGQIALNPEQQQAVLDGDAAMRDAVQDELTADGTVEPAALNLVAYDEAEYAKRRAELVQVLFVVKDLVTVDPADAGVLAVQISYDETAVARDSALLRAAQLVEQPCDAGSAG